MLSFFSADNWTAWWDPVSAPPPTREEKQAARRALRATNGRAPAKAALTKKKSVTIQAPTQPPLSSQPSCPWQSLPSTPSRARLKETVAPSPGLTPGATASVRRDEQLRKSALAALREAPTSVQAATAAAAAAATRLVAAKSGLGTQQLKLLQREAEQIGVVSGRAFSSAADDLEAVHARQKLRCRRQPSAAPPAVGRSVSFAADIVRGAPCAAAAAAAAELTTPPSAAAVMKTPTAMQSEWWSLWEGADGKAPKTPSAAELERRLQRRAMPRTPTAGQEAVEAAEAVAAKSFPAPPPWKPGGFPSARLVPPVAAALPPPAEVAAAPSTAAAAPDPMAAELAAARAALSDRDDELSRARAREVANDARVARLTAALEAALGRSDALEAALADAAPGKTLAEASPRAALAGARTPAATPGFATNHLIGDAPTPMTGATFWQGTPSAAPTPLELQRTPLGAASVARLSYGTSSAQSSSASDSSCGGASRSSEGSLTSEALAPSPAEAPRLSIDEAAAAAEAAAEAAARRWDDIVQGLALPNAQPRGELRERTAAVVADAPAAELRERVAALEKELDAERAVKKRLLTQTHICPECDAVFH